MRSWIRTLDDVRGGGAGGNVRIVNAFDTAQIGDYMGSGEGERVILNVMRRNRRTVRSLVNS